MRFSEEIHNQMLRAVRLQNYKCFEDQLLEFKSLTLLTGLNGTGKSSVNQALLLLRQSCSSHPWSLARTFLPITRREKTHHWICWASFEYG